MSEIARRRFLPLFLCAVLLAVTPSPRADPAASASTSARSVLDGLVGKTQVVGFTVRGGARFLGRVLSSDHSLYVVQTFHYMSAPSTATQTETVIGRNRRRSQVKRQVVTQNVIADDAAVSALLRGVAGASFRPLEAAAPRQILSPGDVLCLQALSPPAKSVTSPRWTLKTLWASPALPPAQATPNQPPDKPTEKQQSPQPVSPL